MRLSYISPRVTTALCLSFALAASSTALAARPAPPKKAKPAPSFPQASVALNGETGAILECNQCHELRAPASMAKVVTAMVGFDALNAGIFSLDDRYALAPATKARSNGALTLSSRGIKTGTMMTIDNLFSAIAVTSAADATLTLSIAVCGTDDCIVDLMNAKVATILKDPKAKTHFTNPHGMPGKGQVTTAYEMARIMQYMMKNYPKQWHYFGQTSYNIDKTIMRGHNRLLTDYKCKNALKRSYNCMEAGKTGFFRYPGKNQGPAAGFNIVGSAAWNGYRVIGVRMGDNGSASRSQNLRRIFDRAFRRLEAQNAPKTVPMPRHFPALLAPRQHKEDKNTPIRKAASLSQHPGF